MCACVSLRVFGVWVVVCVCVQICMCRRGRASVLTCVSVCLFAGVVGV